MLAHPSIESTRPGPAASRYQYQLILPAHTVLHCLLTYLDDDSSRPETVELKSDGSQATALPCTFRRTTRANVIPAMPCALLVSARLSPEEQVITNSSSVLQYSIAVQIIVLGLLHGVRGHAAQRSSKVVARAIAIIYPRHHQTCMRTWCQAWCSAAAVGVASHLTAKGHARKG